MIFEIFGPTPECPSISGHSERFSPGKIRSEVGGPRVSHSPSGRPTSERILPGENRSSKNIGPKIPEKFRAA